MPLDGIFLLAVGQRIGWVYDAVLLSTDLNGRDLAFDLGITVVILMPFCRTRTMVLGDNSVQLHW